MRFAIKKVALQVAPVQSVQVVLGAKLSHVEFDAANRLSLITLADPSIDAYETVTIYALSENQQIEASGEPIDLQCLTVVPGVPGWYSVARREPAQ